MLETLFSAIQTNGNQIITILLILFVGGIGTIGMLILFFKNNKLVKTKDGWKVDSKNIQPNNHELCINHSDHKEKIQHAHFKGKREGVMYSDIRHQLLSERNQLIRELIANEIDKLYHDFYEKNLIEVILQKDAKANPTTHPSYAVYNNFIGRYLQDALKRKTREILSMTKLTNLENADAFALVLEDFIKTLWSSTASFEDRYFSMIDPTSMIFTRKEHAEKELQKRHIFVDIIAGFFAKIRSVVEDYCPKFKLIKEEYGITNDFLDSLGSTEGNMFR